ncbi:hypothetical protein A5893_16795 [Pedobacter psychrophilus]|uniref:Glycoside hydrolase family 42 N-terminal domain-containing protein n=1 Tax=Pedobacter psychrophilus TaxID=1826909 RepID=A0A179DAF3_9SPHI|nr:alpha-amylase family protein [Pedobacter psychrophilus]OAQ38021.1 hypothetical protein A5893_16795 [Pedobacter psychrophilus]
MIRSVKLLFFIQLFLTTTLCFSQEYSETLKRPSWIKDFPILMVGNWDIKPTFRTRVGGNPLWQPAEYAAEHTEERVKQFKAMGATIIMLHFYKGFGLEAEREERENAIKLAALCKKNGLKVGVYIGSTLAYETFLLETPNAKEWIAPDFMGLPVTYGSQTFRKLVYFQHEEYKAYMKRVLKIAVEDLKTDLVHFDNSSIHGIPPVFYHPLAAENFRIFLRKKYTPEMLKKRFGFSDVTYVEPPKYVKAPSRVDDPLMQEWMDFRCQQLADYYGEMEKYIRGLNPEVAVECNPHGLSGNNTMMEYSVDFPRLLSHTDFFWTEGEQTGMNENGALQSKIRTFKMARTLNNRVFTNVSASKIKMAESMAYNRQGFGLISGTEEMEGALPEKSYVLTKDEQEYIKFFKKNFNDYRDVNNIADVAVLHSYNSMANNSERPYVSTFLYEQSLIQGKVPFDVIFDEQLKNLSKYKVLVLADQESLSDDKLELVRNFVKNGGGLVATEHTSLYNEWHLRKIAFGLNDLFKIDPPEWQKRSLPEDILKINVLKHQAGKGRVVYIPEVKPSVKKPLLIPVAGEYLKLALNHNELIDAVEWASGNKLSLHIDAPQTVTMELTEKTDKSKLILHLVNFDYQKTSPADIKVDVLITDRKKIQQIIMMSPDGAPDEKMAFKESDGHLAFTVPKLDVYTMIVIQLK